MTGQGYRESPDYWTDDVLKCSHNNNNNNIHIGILFQIKVVYVIINRRLLIVYIEQTQSLL